MPFPTNNRRPDIPYDPEQVLPNYNRYRTLGQRPPTADQLDGDLNKIIDLINQLADALNKTAAGIAPGAGDGANAHKMLVTDGHDNVFWSFIQSVNIANNAIKTQHLEDAAVTRAKIQAQAIDTDRLHEGAVTNPKVGANTLQLDRLRSTGHNALVVGNNADTQYKELLYNGAPDAWKVPTQAGTVNTLSVQPVSAIWNNSTDNLCSGAKIQDSSLSGTKLQDNTITLAKLHPTARIAVPIGMICAFPGGTDLGPLGFIDCAGQALSRATYADLYAVLGLVYGAGNGSTTFNLPDLRGRSIFGTLNGDTGSRITGNTADSTYKGGAGGLERITLGVNEMPAHSHTAGFIPRGAPPFNPNVGALMSSDSQAPQYKVPVTVDSTGGNQPHNNMPPFLLMRWVIKAL